MKGIIEKAVCLGGIRRESEGHIGEQVPITTAILTPLVHRHVLH